jgi:hypothetical protein
LVRGLHYTAVGPVDVTRGVVGLGVDSATATAALLRERYRGGRLRQELEAAQATLRQELEAAAELVTSLPQTVQDARTKRRRRPLLIAGVAAVVVAGGAVAFSVVRRSRQPEPSPLPPSVEVTPRP